MNGNTCCEPHELGKYEQPQTLMKELRNLENKINTELSDCKKAQQILQDNPQIEELLNILRRCRGRLF